MLPTAGAIRGANLRSGSSLAFAAVAPRLLAAALLVALLPFSGCRDRDSATADWDEARWLGSVRFADVTSRAGIARATPTYDAAVGDVDGDSLPDLYVGNHAAGAVLLRNQGDGTFRDVLPDSGIEPRGDQHGAGWADYDNDGRLDLYVSLGAGRGIARKANRLYRNAGNGRFTDLAAEATATDPEGRSRSVAWLDVDLDGRLDLVLANFASPNRLYLNRGDGRFEDVSQAYGLAELSATRVTWADYDADGFPDLLFGGTPRGMRLMHNDGGARFRDVTRAVGLDGAGAVQGMGFGDYDNDLDLDLALSHGADFTEGVVDDGAGTLRFAFFAHDEPAGFDFETDADAPGVEVELYENGAPITPERIRCGSGTTPGHRLLCAGGAGFPATSEEAPTFIIWRESLERRDCEGCPARRLWHLRWQGHGDHHLSGLVRGAGHAVPIGLQTHVPRGASLWRWEDGTFVRDIDTRDGLPAEAAVNGQAVQWADVDADGWLDLYLVDSGVDGAGSQNVLLLNDAGWRFVAVPESAGASPDSGAGRGVGAHFLDFDHDGRLDLLLTNGWGAPPFDRGPYRLLHNQTEGGHWLVVGLRGRASNRDGLGARIEVESCGERRMRYQNGGTSYFSQSVTPAHFGLGACDGIDAIRILWPSGRSQELRDVAVDTRIEVEEPE